MLASIHSGALAAKKKPEGFGLLVDVTTVTLSQVLLVSDDYFAFGKVGSQNMLPCDV